MRRFPWLVAAVCVLLVVPLLAASNGYAGEGDRWISQLKSADEDERTEAVRHLLKIRSEESARALSDFMDYTFMDWYLKIDIMKFLGEMRVPRSVDSLAVVLGDEMCPALKWNAARALGNFRGNDKAYQTLIKVFPNEDEPQVREGIFLALGDLGDPRAVALLSSLLANESFALRNAAIRALGQIGSADALPALKKALLTEKDAAAQSSLRESIRAVEERNRRM
jgi:HEAT repeat protein